MNSNGTATRSRVQVTHKQSRSIRTQVIHNLIKPLGTRLIKPGKAITGSPELKTPESVYDHCNVRQRQVLGVRIYDINIRGVSTKENFIPAQVYDLAPHSTVRRPQEGDGDSLRQVQSHQEHDISSRDFANDLRAGERRRKQIYYFAGGSWQTPATEHHWRLCAHLCRRLCEQGHPTTVSIISHPLAPKNPAATTLPLLEKLYHELLPSQTPTTPTSATSSTRPDLTRTTSSLHNFHADEDVILAGDSSGGNLALALPLHILTTTPSARAPDAILLISPAVDLRHVNPAMKEKDAVDPLLSAPFVREAAAAWCGRDVSAADPRVSPLLGDLSVLARRDVAVHGVLAGNDVLTPDAMELLRRCEKEGVEGRWLVWEKQMHCFPLMVGYKIVPEANEAVEWMVATLAGG